MKISVRTAKAETTTVDLFKELLSILGGHLRGGSPTSFVPSRLGRADCRLIQSVSHASILTMNFGTELNRTGGKTAIRTAGWPRTVCVSLLCLRR